jgi:hypothetical protein
MNQTIAKSQETAEQIQVRHQQLQQELEQQKQRVSALQAEQKRQQEQTQPQIQQKDDKRAEEPREEQIEYPEVEQEDDVQTLQNEVDLEDLHQQVQDEDLDEKMDEILSQEPVEEIHQQQQQSVEVTHEQQQVQQPVEETHAQQQVQQPVEETHAQQQVQQPVEDTHVQQQVQQPVEETHAQQQVQQPVVETHVQQPVQQHSAITSSSTTPSPLQDGSTLHVNKSPQTPEPPKHATNSVAALQERFAQTVNPPLKVPPTLYHGIEKTSSDLEIKVHRNPTTQTAENLSITPKSQPSVADIAATIQASLHLVGQPLIIDADPSAPHAEFSVKTAFQLCHAHGIDVEPPKSAFAQKALAAAQKEPLQQNNMIDSKAVANSKSEGTFDHQYRQETMKKVQEFNRSSPNSRMQHTHQSL